MSENNKAEYFTVDVPTILHIPKEAFESGLVVVSSSDLNASETDELRGVILKQVKPQVEDPSLLVLNFHLDVLILDEERMRELGWVRASKVE